MRGFRDIITFKNKKLQQQQQQQQLNSYDEKHALFLNKFPLHADVHCSVPSYADVHCSHSVLLLADVHCSVPSYADVHCSHSVPSHADVHTFSSIACRCRCSLFAHYSVTCGCLPFTYRFRTMQMFSVIIFLHVHTLFRDVQMLTVYILCLHVHTLFRDVQMFTVHILCFHVHTLFRDVQMCINLANERLQQYYQGQVFERERQECLSEGVQPVDVVFPSSQRVIDLFMEVRGRGNKLASFFRGRGNKLASFSVGLFSLLLYREVCVRCLYKVHIMAEIHTLFFVLFNNVLFVKLG